jgi:uncharacterized protein YceK
VTIEIARRIVLAAAIAVLISGCSSVATGSGTPAPSISAAPSAAADPSITAEMVKTAEQTILAGVDTAIDGAFEACKAKTQQDGNVFEMSTCDGGKTASLAARKQLVECFARADQAPTPAESISAIMRCQEQLPH